MIVFAFAKKLTRISLAIVLVLGPSGNTKLAYWTPLSPITIINYMEIGRFTPIPSIRIVLSCCYLLIFHLENFSSVVKICTFFSSVEMYFFKRG